MKTRTRNRLVRKDGRTIGIPGEIAKIMGITSRTPVRLDLDGGVLKITPGVMVCVFCEADAKESFMEVPVCAECAKAIGGLYAKSKK